MIFLARSKEGNLLKFEDKSKPLGYVWYYFDKPLEALTKTLVANTDLDLTIVSGGKGETIMAIKPANTNSFKPTGSLKCLRCGTPLKDDTYKTCYTCSMEIKKELQNSPEEKEKQTSIKRQAIMHGVARTLIALQGQVDVNNVGSLIDMLYAKYQEKVG
jgi:uncharacterized CHY-type Zn-finger protein